MCGVVGGRRGGKVRAGCGMLLVGGLWRVKLGAMRGSMWVGLGDVSGGCVVRARIWAETVWYGYGWFVSGGAFLRVLLVSGGSYDISWIWDCGRYHIF